MDALMHGRTDGQTDHIWVPAFCGALITLKRLEDCSFSQEIKPHSRERNSKNIYKSNVNLKLFHHSLYKR